MTRFALLLIGWVTPAVDRESIVGDTIERLEELRVERGRAHARRWLWRETARVLRQALGHRIAARSPRSSIASPERSPIMAAWSQDVRYALRWLRRSPGLAAVAVVTLALGIGANTAMFSVVNAVLLKPLPFANADRLMLVHLLFPDREGGPAVYREAVWSFPKYQTLAGLQRIFDEMGLFGDRAVSLTGDGDPERLRAEVITDRYLSTLGVEPLFGRVFTAAEANQAGAAPVALISHALWSRRYGADRGIVGRNIQISGVSHAVVGVLPRGFRGLNGNADVWQPLAATDAWALTEAQSHSYMLVARRASNVSEADASAAMRVYGSQIDAANREGSAPQSWSASAVSLSASRIDTDLKRVSLVLLGAVGFVLLIACVNLTNLLVAGAMARRREVAIRVALGAGRARVARQFGLEGLVLAGLGAAGGVVVAATLLSLASVILPDPDVFFRSAVTPGQLRITGAAGLTRIGAGMIGLDPATLIFTAGIAILTAVLVSILPAFQASRFRAAEGLKSGDGNATARGARGVSSRAALVAVQIGVAIMLLSGAALMFRSAVKLRGTDLGIDPRSVTTVGLSLPSSSYSADTGREVYAQLVSRVRAIPGVEAAGLGNCAPPSGACNTTIIWFPPAPRGSANPFVNIYWVSPGYFDALRIRLMQGRGFTDADRAGRSKVALVNQTAARTFWPDGRAIGRTIALGQGAFQDGAEVVGVVSDVRYRSIESLPGPQVYITFTQAYLPGMRLFVRSSLDTAPLVAAIGREVHALDANLPLIGVKTMEAYVGDAMWRTRVAMWLLTAFAALALLLTAIGVFGVVAQMVLQRTREFGLRMALGAQKRDVLALVVRRGAVMTGAGLAIGAIASLAATRALGSLLYDVSPTDPETLSAVLAVVAALSLVACYLPARRAMRVDPIVAMKSE